MDTDPLDDSPLVATLLVGIEVTPVPRIEHISVSLKEMGDVVDLTARGYPVSAQLDGVIGNVMGGDAPLQVRRHAVINEWPSRSRVTAVIIGRFGPICGFHERGIEPINTSAVPERRIANALEIRKLD